MMMSSNPILNATLHQPPFLVNVSDIWEKDVGKDIEIGPSAKGWSSVTLTCRSDVFRVKLEFPEPFRGVVYTRGNYGEESPCMADPEGETAVEMSLPNTVCNVIQVSRLGSIVHNLVTMLRSCGWVQLCTQYI